MTSSKSYLSAVTAFHRTSIIGLIASILLVGCPQEPPVEMPPDSPPTTPILDTKGCSPTNVFPFADAVSSSVFDETHIGRGVVSSTNRIAIPYLTKQSTPEFEPNYRLGVRLNSMSTDAWQDFVAVSDQDLSSVMNKSPVLMNIQGKLHLFFQGR